MKVADEDFQIELGSEWRIEREGDSYIFDHESNLQQITVAVLRPTGGIAKSELHDIGREAVRLRQDVIKKLSNGTATFGELVTKEVPGGYDFTFAALDPANGVAIRSITFARIKRVVAVSFNRYAPFPPEEDIDAQFQSLVGKIKLKETNRP